MFILMLERALPDSFYHETCSDLALPKELDFMSKMHFQALRGLTDYHVYTTTVQDFSLSCLILLFFLANHN